jgi:hypothetical protein
LFIAGLHYAIDAFKNFLARQRPQWMVGPYLFDQLLHVISLWLAAAWATAALPPEKAMLDNPWTIDAIGFVLVTFPWFITERILVHTNPTYWQEITAQKWSRMLARVLLLAILLWGGRYLTGASAAVALVIPYSSSGYSRRAALIDLAVVLSVALFVQLAR